MNNKETYAWKLKDVLMIAIIGVLFSFVFLGADYIGLGLTTAMTPIGLGDLGYEPPFGIWYMSAAFAIYVIRKPGSGIVAELISSVLEVIMGNWFGPMVIVSGLIQGLGIEIGFAIFKYRKFDWVSVMISCLTAVIVSLIWNTFRNQYYLIALNINLIRVGMRLVSAALFSGVIVKLLADALARAGVLKAYPIGKKFLKNAPDDED